MFVPQVGMYELSNGMIPPDVCRGSTDVHSSARTYSKSVEEHGHVLMAIVGGIVRNAQTDINNEIG